jgi:hypothetical protein
VIRLHRGGGPHQRGATGNMLHRMQEGRKARLVLGLRVISSVRAVVEVHNP